MLQAQEKRVQMGQGLMNGDRLLRDAAEQELKFPQSLPTGVHLSGNSLSAAKTALSHMQL